MNYQKLVLMFVVIILLSLTGCVLFTQQEWSENYALMDGVRSNSPLAIDGNIETIGEAKLPMNSSGRFASPEIIITLPEKKVIRKIVIHSDNLKKLVIFADKGGTIHSKTDWQLLKELKTVKSYPLEIPILYSHPTDKLRIVITDTTDDGAVARKQKAEFSRQGFGNLAFGAAGSRMFNRRYNNARIGEIEIYGYKTKKDDTISHSPTELE
ncbi:hypothetical protein C6497_15230 [Candidatus Poribacteria bacterium]|nr:MAG: hypothetical protein C6497_15230 [Candidatus Poribacteria bacterium]